MSVRRQLVNQGLAHCEPEIGRWLWALEDVRKRTKRAVESISQAILDDKRGGNSAGTLLYHIGAVELDWLFADVLGQELPPGAIERFPYQVYDAERKLVAVFGETLEVHFSRLDYVRGLLLQVYKPMNLGEFRRVRSYPDRDVSPEWALYHLIRHEAEHQGQILMLCRQSRER